jgi:hypothetical protein
MNSQKEVISKIELINRKLDRNKAKIDGLGKQQKAIQEGINLLNNHTGK